MIRIKIIMLVLFISITANLIADAAEQERFYDTSNNINNMILNKDVVEEPLQQFVPINIHGYTYSGEFPPYRKDAPWYPSFSRPHIDYVPRDFHEALFFNNQKTFEDFVVKFKGILRLWASEARSIGIENPDDIEGFFRDKLNKYYEYNKDYFASLYPGLTEKQYRLLMVMNLVHGNYDFGTQTKQTRNLLELIELKTGDCSEQGDLVASLAYLQGIDGKYLGLSWDYNTVLGQFISGHMAFYADGLWVDPEINIAFKIDFEELQKIEPSKRLFYLIQQKSILGFYNWYINPEVRAAQLANNQDGGTIAFYYYYYFEGINQGNSNIMPYIPRVVLNHKNSNKISIASTQRQFIEKDNGKTHDFILMPGQSAEKYWEQELLTALEGCDPSTNYDDINSEIGLLNSLGSLIEYYGKQEDCDKEKLRRLVNLAYVEFDQIFDARGVKQGQIKGWGRAEKFDAFQDGSINPEFTKYSYQTFAICLGILNVIDAINNYTPLSDVDKNLTEGYISSVKVVLDSWAPKFKVVEDGKGFYYYSELECDDKVIFSVSGVGISTFLELYKLNGDSDYMNRAKELAAYLVDYIKVDPYTGSYIWPYDLSSQCVDNVNDAMFTSGGIIDAIKFGILKKFDIWRMERSINSFWSQNPSKPNVYVANTCLTGNYGLSAGINFAQYYNLTGNADYLWKYARQSLITSLYNIDNSQSDNSLQLKLLGLLFETQPEIVDIWWRLYGWTTNSQEYFDCNVE